MPPGTTFRNEAAARVIPTIATYRPGRAAKKIAFPILFCVSNTDTVTPPAQTLRYARTAPRGEIKTYDAGHFDFYLGEPFEALVRDQIEFLTRHLAPGTASRPSPGRHAATSRDRWTPAMNFASLPDRRAELDPHGPAVSDGHRSLTNAQLLRPGPRGTPSPPRPRDRSWRRRRPQADATASSSCCCCSRPGGSAPPSPRSTRA